MFRSALAENQLMAVGIGDDEIAHAVGMRHRLAGDIGAAGDEIVIQRVDALAENADHRHGGGRQGCIQMDGRIAATKACVIRRIAPDEFAREAELVAVIGECRRQVFDLEDGGVPRDLECRIGHGRASRRAPVCGLLHRCRKR